MVAVPAPATASAVSDEALMTVLGSSSSLHLMGAAKLAAGFGTITSGFRSAEHNRRVGGVPTSYHLLGRAIDVQRRLGVTHPMVDAALRRAGFVLVESLDEGDHSHFAFESPTPISAAQATARVVAPVPPSGPIRAEVLADDHGVLLSDSPGPVLASAPSHP
jgi:hypothetical protein